jgi:hypothetical protein
MFQICNSSFKRANEEQIDAFELTMPKIQSKSKKKKKASVKKSISKLSKNLTFNFFTFENGAVLAIENLMKKGVKSISKILNTETFSHKNDPILAQNFNFSLLKLNFANFEKFSFYLLSVHYKPTLAIKYT